MSNGKIREIKEFTKPPVQTPVNLTEPTLIPVAELPDSVERNKQIAFKRYEFVFIAEFIVGIILLYVGITTAGSFYSPASRLYGELAMLFYMRQGGTLAEIAGAILIYDSFRRIEIGTIEKIEMIIRLKLRR